MKRKKRGSSLIVTIIIFMFITTVSLAMLSMVSTNYYGRASESKRTQNLYGSESGLDIKYNIIAKTVEAANVYGDAKVQKLKAEVKNMDYDDYSALGNSEGDKDKKRLYALYSDIDYFKYYNGTHEGIQNPKSQSTIDNNMKSDNKAIDSLVDKVFKENFKFIIQRDLKNSINDNSYIKMVKNSEGNLEEKPVVIQNVGDFKIQPITDDMFTAIHKGDKTDIERTLKVESGYNDEGKIIYNEYSLDIEFYNQENYELSITSEFETNISETNSAKIGKSLRTIQANYSLRVPNYSEVAFKESTANLTSDVKDIVGLTIGKDMIVNSNKLTVTGDIFVQGNESGEMTSSNRTFEKYSGGIILDNPSGIQKTINFNNNVFTRGTFNIKNNVDTVIAGDLYARNIYAGDGKNLSKNSSLNISKEAVIDNDLSVKAAGTTITINDFYGINEKNTPYKNGDIDNLAYPTTEKGKERTSSSIIINGPCNNSEVQIKNTAYIMGVAHINTDDGYQTGESVAVKSDDKANYNAYSIPVHETDKFKYDRPLQVLDEWNVFEKSKHFYEYWKPIENTIDSGGIIIPKESINNNKIHSIGAIVYKESKDGSSKVLESNYSHDFETTVEEKRNKYAKNIYTISEAFRNNPDLNINNLYTSIGEGAETVGNLLSNMNSLEDDDYKFKKGSSIINRRQRMAIFAPQENTVVIKGTGSIGTYGSNDIVIDATTNSNVDAVIVAAGDVIIDGNVNFRGDIIAQGNLNVLGNSTANIYYDKYVTEDIQMSNGAIFNKVFGNGFGGQVLDNGDLDIKSNASDFLKTRLWKIIQ